MNTDQQDSSSVAPSSSGFLIYIVVVILVAIFLTYLTMMCLIRPGYFRRRFGRTDPTLADSLQTGAAEMEQSEQSIPYPTSRRQSIDPALLNQFTVQTFYSEKSHKSLQEVTNPGPEDCHIVEIHPDDLLEYPKQAHLACSGDPASGPPDNSVSLSEMAIDATSLASSSFDVCAICLDQYEEGLSKTRMLPCTHYFHVECIDKWLLRENTTTNCPCCNFDVSTTPRMDTGESEEPSRPRHLSNMWWICSPRDIVD